MKKSLLLILTFFWMVGCAQKVHVDHAPQPMPAVADKRPKVLILPFASYALQGNFSQWLKMNAMFYEGVSDGFIKMGLASLPFEEAFWLCRQNGYIEISYRKPRIPKSLTEILNDPEFSEVMKSEVRNLIQQEMRKTSHLSFNVNPLIKLTEDELWSLANMAGTRYVVRGRITEFYLRDEDTLNPFKIGFLNFPIRFTSRSLYGRPSDRKWGLLQEVSIGFGFGALLGSQAHDPFEPPREETVHIGHPLLGTTVTKTTGGTEDYDIGNALVWGMVGTGLALLSNHGGRSPEVVIGFALYVYDAKRKELVWANRVRIRVSPETLWASAHPEDLFYKGVEEASRMLMDRFWKDQKTKSNLALASLTPEISQALERAEGAARRAEQAAKRSEKAAQRAERAATKAERIFEKTLIK